MIAVRPATPADAEEISRVLVASITELCAADHRNHAEALAGWLANKSPGSIRSWLDSPDSRLYVVEHDGVVAAAGGINTDREITLNYVDPGHRFSGVSSALLAALESALGPGEARLTSTVTAHRFYLSRGWSDDGAAGCDGGLSGHRMRKRL